MANAMFLWITEIKPESQKEFCPIICSCVCVFVYLDKLIDPSQVSQAVSRRFSCSPMKTICFTSKLWMRLEPANRVRLHSFPPKVTNNTLYKIQFVPVFGTNIFSYCFPLAVSVFRDKVPPAERFSSPCSGALRGPNHCALLSQCAWKHIVYRQRVSFSQLLLPLRPLPLNMSTRVCVFSRCPSILGELLLPQGRYYWETIVSGGPAYRLGVSYSIANRNSPLGENNVSWCLQCILTPSGYV